MTALRALSASWRRVCMTLAVLALVIKVAVPAGYMLGASAQGSPALVICTAQGLVTLDDHGAPATPNEGARDAPCAFAGHGAPFTASEPLTISATEHVAYAPLAPRAASAVVPGRGLAAPPLPARGPPQAI